MFLKSVLGITDRRTTGAHWLASLAHWSVTGLVRSPVPKSKCRVIE